MKHLCFLLFFTMTAALSAAAPAATAAKPAETATKPAATAAAKPAETASKSAETAAAKSAETATKPATTAKPAVSVLTSIYSPDRDPAEFADPEKAENLLNRRAELVKKIQDERKRLLKEDNSAKKLNEEIMLLNRKLASLLETKKTMIELNSQLRELDISISRLKPAPPPEPETKDDDKTEKE
jgi:hypothetical protein